jgi:hypothetical protein
LAAVAAHVKSKARTAVALTKQQEKPERVLTLSPEVRYAVIVVY